MQSISPCCLLIQFPSTKLQKAQWDRLDALNKKRSSLEALILTSMKSIEQHSANISNEMGAMFGGRIEEIQESSASQVAKDLASFDKDSFRALTNVRIVMWFGSSQTTCQSGSKNHCYTILLYYAAHACTDHFQKRRRQ